jgi:hypothetical protein
VFAVCALLADCNSFADIFSNYLAYSFTFSDCWFYAQRSVQIDRSNFDFSVPRHQSYLTARLYEPGLTQQVNRISF